MTPNPGLGAPHYLAGYPADLQAEVRESLALGVLADRLRQRYGEPHRVRTDGALYDYAMALKSRHLRSSERSARSCTTTGST